MDFLDQSVPIGGISIVVMSTGSTSRTAVMGELSCIEWVVWTWVGTVIIVVSALLW